MRALDLDCEQTETKKLSEDTVSSAGSVCVCVSRVSDAGTITSFTDLRNHFSDAPLKGTSPS